MKFSTALFVHDLVTYKRLRNLILLLNQLKILLGVNETDRKATSRHLISPTGNEGWVFPVPMAKTALEMAISGLPANCLLPMKQSTDLLGLRR